MLPAFGCHCYWGQHPTVPRGWPCTWIFISLLPECWEPPCLALGSQTLPSALVSAPPHPVLEIEPRPLCMLGKSYSPSLFALIVHTHVYTFCMSSSIPCMFLARAPFIVNLEFLINNKWMLNIIMNDVQGRIAALSHPNLRTRVCLLQVRLN